MIILTFKSAFACDLTGSAQGTPICDNWSALVKASNWESQLSRNESIELLNKMMCLDVHFSMAISHHFFKKITFLKMEWRSNGKRPFCFRYFYLQCNAIFYVFVTTGKEEAQQYYYRHHERVGQRRPSYRVSSLSQGCRDYFCFVVMLSILLLRPFSPLVPDWQRCSVDCFHSRHPRPCRRRYRPRPHFLKWIESRQWRATERPSRQRDLENEQKL